jgi:membrane protease YdiL (CAAX protease family)
MNRSHSSSLVSMLWSAALACVLTVAAGGVWTVLLLSNLAISPSIPWAVVVMALILWLMWQYLGGRWGPQSTTDARRRYRRARLLSGRVFAWALGAGMLSVVALVGFWIVLGQLVKIPTHLLLNVTDSQWFAVVPILVMASLVSSLAEEVGFRGYFQGIAERSMGGPLAIMIATLLIAPAHGLTQGFVWPVLLWYLCVDAMLGALAYFTQSILPGIVVHSSGLLVFFTVVWPSDQQRRLIWESGAGPGFWFAVTLTAISLLLAILTFSQLARSTSDVRPRAGSIIPASRRQPAG